MTIVHRLPLSGGHVMHVEEHGNPEGLPALVLHGGPGSGGSPLLRSGFDPTRYRIICPDQRGAGRSTPTGSIVHNTLADLLDDLRLLREHLHVDRWLVVGGSWGATLALLHALDQPSAVAGLLLRNTFLARTSDIHDFFAEAARRGDPEWRVLWNEARRRQCPVATVLADIFAHGTWEAQRHATLYWFAWEQRLSGGTAATPDDAVLQRLVPRYRVLSHYLHHGCWLRAPTLLARCAALPAVPTLIVHGTRDAMCPPQGAQALARVLHGRAILQWAQGAGHDPTHPALAAAMKQALCNYANTQTFSANAP
ncbi:proline iminopeptidase [Variovorax boronicumulans]|uniref:alpha/beta fold hydrolase n=1 Tax=Variovorax TaxID=34072 RepID=UPI0027829FCF|nr:MULTISPECIES: alpha/beta fold hydrolase [Variovorax]MDQ0038879.1 proline iminopeptidase [Variovorax boronicumulans]MDQ0610814.1 proline iminopeptidase [Variovorax sp. W1I1]